MKARVLKSHQCRAKQTSGSRSDSFEFLWTDSTNKHDNYSDNIALILFFRFSFVSAENECFTFILII